MEPRVQRRDFIAGSLAATAAVGLAPAIGNAAEAQPVEKREVYELRQYLFKAGEMVTRAHEYFQKALIPALRRAGTGPVGVLVESAKPDAPITYFVLVVHPSIESVITVPKTIESDAEYLKAGADFLKAPPEDPGYINLETRLMLAADFMPKLEAPEKKDTRIFELRRYRNPGQPAFRKKLEMFGKGGELTIFRRVGLAPVFFGEMLMGPDMPNVTYMLTFPDAEAKTRGWASFGQDADWHKLSKTPGYTDPEIIANIKSIMLKPAAYSEI